MNITQDKILIKRTSKEHIQNILKENLDWKILDIGCGYNANPLANVICDIQDLSNHYKDKKFIRLNSNENKLPFKDKEFDFVIASHVLEHVRDFKTFISEIERISNQGYIEVPTKLEDNLVFENKIDHIWHMDFDDVNQNLEISPRYQILEPVLTVSSIKKFNEYFKKSFILELYWSDKINYVFLENKKNFKKLSVLNLFKKYFSKKLRMFFK